MRYLDRRHAGDRVAVEREQPVLAVGIDHRVERAHIATNWNQLGALDAPAGILDALAERDQPQEQLVCQLLLLWAEAGIDLLGAASKRAQYAPADLIGHQCKSTVGSPLEHLSQRVLQQRQRARLLADIADNRFDQLGGHKQTIARSEEHTSELQ